MGLASLQKGLRERRKSIMSVSFDFKDKMALITGGASGIGEACVLTFARAGAKVLIADLKYWSYESNQ
jgi:hypothetical protein